MVILWSHTSLWVGGWCDELLLRSALHPMAHFDVVRMMPLKRYTKWGAALAGEPRKRTP